MKVKSIDHSSPYLYPSRTVEIRTGQGTVETPVRAATYYEYKQKIRVPTAAPIESPILVNVKKLSSAALKNLLTKNESYGELLRRIDHANRIGQYAQLRLTILQPTASTYEPGTPSSMQVLKGSSHMLERFLRFNIRIQQDAGQDLVTIPYIEIPYPKLKPILVDLHKGLSKTGAEPVFFIDMKYEPFSELMDLLTNKLQCRLVGLFYRPYASYPIHYDSLRQYHDQDVAFVTVQTSRFDSNYDDISTMHYLPFLGNDISAVQIPPPPFFDDEEKAGSQLEGMYRVPRLQKVRFFDKQTLKVKPLAVSPPDPNKVLADIKYEDHEMIVKMLANSQEVNSDNQKFLQLSSFSKVHELNTSLLEFRNLRTYIEQGTTVDYVDDRKSSLHPALAQVAKKSRLNGFS